MKELNLILVQLMKNFKIGSFGVISILLLMSFNSFSQNNEDKSSINQIQPIKIPDGLQHSPNKIKKDDWNLVDYQFKVDEIQIKIDWVKNNSEETEKANASNWFEMAYKLLEDAKHDRDLHIEKYGYEKINGFPQRINTDNQEEDNALYDRQLSEWINAHPHTKKDHSQINY